MKKLKMADPRTTRVADLKAGQYADGRPLDDVQYLECKLILKTDEFTSTKGFRKYGKLVAQAAKDCGVGFDTSSAKGTRPAIREVMFLDSDDFRLYNNAFILRRRIPYQEGFPIGDPEIVFKFRHPDMQTAAEVDVRPNIAGDYRIKFKVEALPLKDQIGGIRMLFSHNVEFGLSGMHQQDKTSLDTLVDVLPALSSLKRNPGERVELVGDMIVEEVLQDIGRLDFGAGIAAVSNVALWRARGDHRPLIGEFAFQIKFKRREDLNEQAMKRAEKFFLGLQNAAKDWIALGATKTGVVYRLKGNPPHAHE